MNEYLTLSAAVLSACCAFGATAIQTALDNTSLSFTTGGDVEWFVQSDDVHAGSTALRSGVIGDSQETWVETTVAGAGTVSFWWKASSESVSWDWLEVSVDGNVQDKIGGSDAGWEQKSAIAVGTGFHSIRWRYCKDSSVSSGADCGWLDKVAWTPAPEEIRVNFITNGGDPVDSRGFEPGAYGSSLPVPSRDGYVFAGWYSDPGLTQPLGDSLLPLVESTTVYAKWWLPVSELDDGTFSFWNEGEVDWAVEPDSGVSGKPAAVAELPANQTAELVTAVEGKGILSFKWKGDGYDGDLSCTVGGEKWSFSGRSSGAWQEENIVVLEEGAHGVCWTLNNRMCGGRTIRYLICDFAWTPAPEKMTVSLDADGGRLPGGSELEFGPGDTYGDLPTPVRTGGWIFAGWHLDSPTGAEVRADELVPFEENIRLVALWKRPVANYMRDANFTYGTTGEDKFYQMNVKTPAGNFAAGVTLTKSSYPHGTGGSSETSTDKPATLSATVTGPGFLTFGWAAVTPRDTSVQGVLLLDKEEVADFDYSSCSAELGSPASDREHVYIPAGKHTLSWVAYGSPSFEYNGDGCVLEVYTLLASPTLLIGDIAFEKAGPQETPQAWMGKFLDYGVFVTGDPARFKASYAARIARDKADYEARIFHALASLAELAENADFKKFAKTFGFTVDYTRCSFTGKTKLDSNTAGVNAMVDKALSFGVPVLKTVLADLEAIPADWTGSVRLSADEWPIDEDVCIDRGDVRYARASLEGAIATLYFMGGYDLTADWAKGKSAFEFHHPLPVLPKIPAVDDELAWESVAPRRADGETLNYEDYTFSPLEGAMLRAAQCGNTVAFRLEADGLEVRDEESVSAGFGIRSGDTEIDFWPYSYWSGVQWYVECGDTFKPVTCSIEFGDGCILFKFDCSKVSGFSKKTWSLDEGHVDVLSAGSGCCSWNWDDARQDAKLQKLLIEQAKFLSKVRKASRLDESRKWVRAALESALAADGAVRGRADDGRMHFVEYDPEDGGRLEIARANTSKALSALDGAMEFNVRELYETVGPRNREIDLTLLPDDGWMSVCLGALFEGRITRAMKPGTHLNRCGEMIADVDSLEDPTFAGLFPGMTVGKWRNVSDAFGRAEETPARESELVPGEKVALHCPQYIGYSVSGLPKGWKWNSKTGMLTGTTPGARFTLTFSAGGMKARESFEIGSKPTVFTSVAGGGEGAGVKSVTDSKAYAANATAKVIAVLKSGYAFAGWYDAEGRLASPNLSHSFKMPLTDVYLEARAIALGEDCLELYPEEQTVELGRGIPVSTEDGRYLYCRSGSPYTMSAKGLPAGVKLVQSADLTHYYLSGAPTKDGVYYATFNAKNNGGYRNSCVIRFVVGGAAEKESDKANIDLSDIADYDPYTGYYFEYRKDVPDSPVNGAVKKIKVSGQPKGWTATGSVSPCGSMVILSGRATAAGVYTLKVTVTYRNGKTAVTEKKVVVYDNGSAYLPVQVAPGQSDRGSVSGGGVYAIGSQVKVKATPAGKNKYFFAGWYRDENCQMRCGSLSADGEWRKASATVPFDSDWGLGGLYAKFVTKDEDAIAIDCGDVWRVETSYGAFPESFPIQVDSESLPTLSVKSLPAGIKLSGKSLIVSKPASLQPGSHLVTFTAKNLSGNSVSKQVRVIIPNLTQAVDNGCLDLDTSDKGYCQAVYGEDFQAGVKVSFSLADLGVWVADGWKLSVSGLPSGWTYKSGVISGTAAAAGPKTVTFKVTKGGKSYKATATFDLSPLPDWAVGTFVGSTLTTYGAWGGFEEGTISCTVSAAGKVSGKYVMSGDNSKTTFSGSGFKREDGSLVATVSGKVDGKKKSFALSLWETGSACFSGKISGSESIASELLVKNPWTGPTVERATLPRFAENVTCSFGATGFFKGAMQGGTVSLSFSGDGVVSGKFATKKGTVTAGLQLADFSFCRSDSEWAGWLVIGIPANKSKKIAGYCAYRQFHMVAEPDGLVHEVDVGTPYDLGLPLEVGFGFFGGGYW